MFGPALEAYFKFLFITKYNTTVSIDHRFGFNNSENPPGIYVLERVEQKSKNLHGFVLKYRNKKNDVQLVMGNKFSQTHYFFHYSHFRRIF